LWIAVLWQVLTISAPAVTRDPAQSVGSGTAAPAVSGARVHRFRVRVVTFRPAPELTRSFRRPGCNLLGVSNTRRRCACWGAGRNRIITAASQRVTARNTQERQPGATHDSVPIQRLHGKLRTAGHEAARLRQRGRYPPLVNIE
jgi:hypothetical protein